MDIGQTFIDFIHQTGFATMTWQQAVMLVIACVLLYLAIVKQYEPMLLLPIAFGMLLANLPGANLGVHYSNIQEFSQLAAAGEAGLIDYLYLGVKLGIYPPLIFMGVGAMTDFGPLIANPKSLLLGAAAQLGILLLSLAHCFWVSIRKKHRLSALLAVQMVLRQSSSPAS